MNNETLIYATMIILFIVGVKGIISFYKNDSRSPFQSTAQESELIKKTIGKNDYSQFHKLIWSFICIIASIGLLIHLLKN